MAQFRCPICRSQFFRPVEVKRADGRRYTTEFLECAGCSVMFRDADKFTRFEPYTAPVTDGGARKSEKLAYYEQMRKETKAGRRD